MGFRAEPTHYVKTVMSDLQGAWGNLREAVVDAHPFPESAALLLHIDEGMSWESVRNLAAMRAALLLIRNIVAQNAVPETVREETDAVLDAMEELDAAIAEGRRV